MYLTFKNLKINRKEGNQQIKKQETSTNHLFQVCRSENNVRLMSLEVEMHKSKVRL